MTRVPPIIDFFHQRRIFQQPPSHPFCTVQYPRFLPFRRLPPALLLVACLAGTAALHADDRVTVRGKASAGYMTWKFGFNENDIKNESYVFNQGRFFGGSNRDAGLEKTPFLDLAKSVAGDLAGQHYFPASALQKANLLIVVDWGVTTVANSTYDDMALNSSLGAANIDAARQDTLHQMATDERAKGSPTPTVQMLDQGYEMRHLNGLASDAEFKELDQKSMGQSIASNAVLVGFDEDLRADDASPFGTAKGPMLRAFMTDERYFVVLKAYDCQEYLKTKQLRLVWSMRLSTRALDGDFRTSVNRMLAAGREDFGRETDGVEIKRVPLKPAPVTPEPAGPFSQDTAPSK